MPDLGLAMSPKKHLMVLETDSKNPSLVHMSQNGQWIGQYVYQPLSKSPAGTKIRFMAVFENILLVSDLGKLISWG